MGKFTFIKFKYLWSLGNNKNLYAYFQNGYHQYEIFKYLKTKNIPIEIASKSVMNLINNDGGFAPYPGGGHVMTMMQFFFFKKIIFFKG